MKIATTPVPMHWETKVHSTNGIATSATIAELLGKSAYVSTGQYTYSDIPASVALVNFPRGTYYLYGMKFEFNNVVQYKTYTAEYFEAPVRYNAVESVVGTDIYNITNILSNRTIWSGNTGAWVIPNIVYGTIEASSALTSLSMPNLVAGGIRFNYQSNPNLISLDFPSLQSVDCVVGFSGTTNFTTISAPVATKIVHLEINQATKLSTVNMPNVEQINYFNITGGTTSDILLDMPKLTKVNSFVCQFSNKILYNLPNLETAEYLSLRIINQTTLSLPSLVYAGYVMLGDPVSSSYMSPVTTINLPKLEIVKNLQLGYMSATTISFPALKTVGGYDLYSGFIDVAKWTALTTMSFPALEFVGCSCYSGCGLPREASFKFIDNTPNLTNFTIGPNLKTVVGGVHFTSCSLNQASVDHILVRLAALDGTNGTTIYQNKTVQITGTSATPSATGLAAKATLVARGCTVTHN